jgi:predicted metal-dependent hydrolase
MSASGLVLSVIERASVATHIKMAGNLRCGRVAIEYSEDENEAGTCSTDTRRIRLNLELAKKPFQCLECTITHEMVHLIERCHFDREVP